MMVGFDGTCLTKELEELISNEKIGSVILFARNIESAEQVAKLTESLQEHAKSSGHKHPLIIATDQENGIVSRLDQFTLELPGNMLLGAVDDYQTTYDVSAATAKILKRLGINLNLAPVLDCNSNPDNPVIGVRSFGENPQKVARHGVEFINGHRDAGIIACGKHFPGHGDTHQDSHHELPVVSSSLEQLKEIEFVPFAEAIKNDVASLMISHVHYPAIDDNPKTPASLSEKVINGLLRREMDYKGLVLTDCLEMNAVSKTVGTPEGALRALKSGADILMVSHTYAEQIKTIDHIEQAVLRGELKMETIDSALSRINKVKESYLQWETEFPETTLDEEVEANQVLAQTAFEQGVTVVERGASLPKSEKLHIHALWMLENSQTIVEDKKSINFSINDLIQNLTGVSASEQSLNNDVANLAGNAGKADVIVLLTDISKPNQRQLELIKSIPNQENLIVAAIKSPYVLSYFKEAGTLIATYGSSEKALQTCMGIIAGKIQPKGRLPITIRV